MSILRYKQKLMPYGNPMDGGGGGGGGGGSPAPTSQSVSQTTIPDYAKTYVEDMLGRAESLTTQSEYQPYAGQRFAGFTPMQAQAFQNVANQQVAGQVGEASDLASQVGRTSLGAFGQGQQLGQQALGYGSQAAGMSGMGFGAGQRFEAMATSPEAQRSFMSPYMQNVVDWQKEQAIRDYNINRQAEQARSVGAGAFGGSRQAVAQAEANRALMNQLGGIQATGTQKAFEDAQRQMQFGADLGLRGLGAGYQGLGMGLQGVQGAVGAGQYGLAGLGQAGTAASTLGALGQTQFQQQSAINEAMARAGAQQQALQQQGLSANYQDYLTQMNYPYQQLSFMSNILRGVPLGQQQTAVYQAQPTATQQAIGLAGAGASLYRAEGGPVKAMREGGIAGYKYGGIMPDPKLEATASRLSIEQLQERLRDPQLTPGERQVIQSVLQDKMAMKARMSGIAAAGGPAFESQGMAGGGIVAFEDGGLSMLSPEFGGGQQAANTGEPMTVEELFRRYPGLEGKVGIAQIQDYTSGRAVPPEWAKMKAPEAPPVAKTTAPAPTATKTDTAKPKVADTAAPAPKQAAPTSFGQFLEERRAAGPQGQLGADFESYLSERLGKSAERLDRDERLAMAKGFLKFASTPAPGGIGQAAAAGLGEYVTGIEAARKTQDTMQMEMQKARMELDKARRAEARGDVSGAQESYDKYQDRMNRLQTAQISAGAAGQAGRFEEKAVEKVMADNPGMKFAEALQIVRGAGRTETVEVQRAKAALEQINNSLLFMKKDDPNRAQLEAQRQKLIQMLTPGGGIGGGQTTSTGGGVLRFDAQGNLIKG